MILSFLSFPLPPSALCTILVGGGGEGGCWSVTQTTTHTKKWPNIRGGGGKYPWGHHKKRASWGRGGGVGSWKRMGIGALGPWTSAIPLAHCGGLASGCQCALRAILPSPVLSLCAVPTIIFEG